MSRRQRTPATEADPLAWHTPQLSRTDPHLTALTTLRGTPLSPASPSHRGEGGGSPKPRWRRAEGKDLGQKCSVQREPQLCDPEQPWPAGSSSSDQGPRSAPRHRCPPPRGWEPGFASTRGGPRAGSSRRTSVREKGRGTHTFHPHWSSSGQRKLLIFQNTLSTAWKSPLPSKAVALSKRGNRWRHRAVPGKER